MTPYRTLSQPSVPQRPLLLRALAWLAVQLPLLGDDPSPRWRRRALGGEWWYVARIGIYSGGVSSYWVRGDAVHALVSDANTGILHVAHEVWP